MFFTIFGDFTRSLLIISFTFVSIFFGSLGIGGFALFSFTTFIFSFFGYMIYCVLLGPSGANQKSPARDMFLMVVHGVITFVSICLYVTWEHDNVQHMESFADGWSFFSPYKFYIAAVTLLISAIYSFLCWRDNQNQETD